MMKVFFILIMLVAYSTGYSQSQDTLNQLPAYQPVGEHNRLEGVFKRRNFSKMNKFVVDGQFVTSKFFLETLDSNDDYSFVIQVDTVKKEKVVILKKK